MPRTIIETAGAPAPPPFSEHITQLSEHAAGTCQLGFDVVDLERFCRDLSGQGVEFTSPPTVVHGQKIARFKDADGAECSVSGR